MFKALAQLLHASERQADALEGLLHAAHAGVTDGSQVANLESRLNALELAMEKRYAEAEALQVKAQSVFNAARAAEERARRHAANGVEEGDSEDEELERLREAYEAAGVPVGHGGGGEEEGMQAMPGAMGRRRASKLNAYDLKRGRR